MKPCFAAMKPRFAAMKPHFAAMNPRMKYGITTVLVCLLLCMHASICHATPPDTIYAADHRRTLYWNPDVVTDKYGQAYIEFYGSSVSKALDVSVEGVTKYGEFIVKAR